MNEIFFLYDAVLALIIFALLSSLTKNYLFYLGMIVSLVLFNWQIIPYLDRPFFDDAQTQRLFIGTLPFWDILNHYYPDNRHPPLFYLVLSFFLDWSTEEWVARLPALIFGTLSLVGLCFLGKECKNEWVGVVATVLMASHPLFLEQCGQVSDVSLFLSLLIASNIILLRYISKPKTMTLGLLVLLETGMVWSYYMGIVVLFVHVILLVRNASWAEYRWGIVGLTILNLPVFNSFSKLIIQDLQFRDSVTQNPEHLWGNENRLSLVVDYVNLFSFGGKWEFTALLLFSGLIWFKKNLNPKVYIHIQLLLLAGLVLSFGAPVVRLKSYYALFALPSLCLLVALGATSLGQWVSFPILTVLGIAINTSSSSHQQIMSTALYPNNGFVFAELAAYIKKEETPTILVADAENNYSLLLYYLEDDPVEHYSSCVNVSGAAMGCSSGSMTIQTLTPLTKMTEGWQRNAVEYLEQNMSVPYWLMYNPRFKNELVLQHIDEMCIKKKDWGPINQITLYQCKPSASVP
jgi:hypothetical protein